MKKNTPPPVTQEGELIDKIDELKKTTEQIEAEKEQKRLAREERKFLKAEEKKRKKIERFIGPLLLILTVVISYLVLATHK
jgi:hypothetical protein